MDRERPYMEDDMDQHVDKKYSDISQINRQNSFEYRKEDH